MNIQDTYEVYYRQIPLDIKKYKSSNKRIVFGYTSDLDVLIDWDSQAFEEIVSSNLFGEPTLNKFEKIDSIESFSRIVSYYIIHGLGGEIEITQKEVCEILENQFNTNFALGGTCAQASTALGTLGFSSIVHITDKSQKVIQQMDGLGIDVINGDRRVPIIVSATDDMPVRHMILQYPKGAKIKINGRNYIAPDSNRIIMDYDRIHKYVPIETGFLDYCEKNARDILAYSSSGFNSIIETNIMKEMSDKLSKHYKKIKEQNPDCIVFLESAHYMNSDVNDIVFDRLSNSIDFLGLNEEELIAFTCKHGIQVNKKDLASVLTGLEFLKEKYSFLGMVLHTKDYAMYYGKYYKGMDFTKGLTLGNLMACTRARIGKYGSYEECGESLQLPLSRNGISFAEQLEKIHTPQFVHIIPSRYMEHPKFTIGLGDTFVAGFMTSFIN